MKELSGKIAVVTGGGSGMGQELVRLLVAEGCHVAMCDVSPKGMAETEAACKAAGLPQGVRITSHIADVSNEPDVLRFRDEVKARHAADRIHLLFNNAGIGGGGSLIAVDRAEWERTFNIVWGGVYFCTRAFLPLLQAAEEAHLVNTSSINGFWASVGPDTKLVLLANPRVPLVWQPEVSQPTGGSVGLGDTTLNLLLGPKARGIVFWSLGAASRFPTGTDRRLGPFDTGSLSLGPATSVVFTPGPVVVGATVSQVWSVAGRRGATSVSALAAQAVFDVNLPRGWYLASSPLIVANWTAPPGSRWVVPVGGGIGKLTLLNQTTALSVETHAYWVAVRPDLGPSWTLRLQAMLSFPQQGAR